MKQKGFTLAAECFVKINNQYKLCINTESGLTCVNAGETGAWKLKHLSWCQPQTVHKQVKKTLNKNIKDCLKQKVNAC
jgi:hypothetical protein